MFGWNDAGGGTSYPRRFAIDLVEAGHEVAVFYASVPTSQQETGASQHEIKYRKEEGVSLYAVTHRPTPFLDIFNPAREVNYPPIVESFKSLLEDFLPDIIHYHNFLGLSLGLTKAAYDMGIPGVFTAHNFWLLCPTLYLLLPNGRSCSGASSTGENCLSCAKYHAQGLAQTLPESSQYALREKALQEHFQARLVQGFVNSRAVYEQFISCGYSADKLQVQPLVNPRCVTLWSEVGKHRNIEHSESKPLRIAYMGQVIPIKGVHLLVQAIQSLVGDFRLDIFGMGDPHYIQQLQAIDTTGKVCFHGEYSAADQIQLLKYVDLGVMCSICFEQSPLVIGEFLSARIPVIVAEAGGALDYIQADACLTYAPEDVNALKRHLQRLLDEPDVYQSLQAAIKPPNPTPYTEIMLKHYLQAQEKFLADPHFFDQRIKHLVQSKEISFYDAESLAPIKTVKKAEAYGIYVNTPLHDFRAKQGDLRLQEASWVITHNANELPLIQPLNKKGHWLPMWRAEKRFYENAHFSESEQFLVFIEADSDYWEELIKLYLKKLHQRVCLVILPWKISVEEAENKLLNFFEVQALEPETLPDIFLVDEPELNYPLIIEQMQFICLPQKNVSIPILHSALNAHRIYAKPDVVNAYPAYERQDSPFSTFPLELNCYAPTTDREKHNSTLVKRLKSLRAKGF